MSKSDPDRAALPAAQWRKSSYSGGGNDCVEIAFTGDGAAVRDSKNPDDGGLSVSAHGWRGLLESVRSGRIDLS